MPHIACCSAWPVGFSDGLVQFGLVFVFMLLPGALGGILSVLHILDTRELMAPARELEARRICWRRFWAAIGLGAAGGFGGASAMLLVGVTTNQLTLTFDGTNLAKLFSLGLVTGFLGFRLLKSVADKVDKQIRENIAESEQRQAKKLEQLKEVLTERAGYIDQAKNALHRKAPDAELEILARILAESHKQDRSDRRLAIVLGNLYDALKRPQDAIAIVTDVLQAKTVSSDLGKNKDIADLLFNRACYRVPPYKIAKAASKTDECKRLMSEIISDLELSFEKLPANKEIARVDDDLRQLAGNPDFDAFMAS